MDNVEQTKVSQKIVNRNIQGSGPLEYSESRKFYFLAVNYNTSNEIENWVSQIKIHKPDAFLYVVDNFFDDKERLKATTICNNLGVKIIYSENLGYGHSLNVGLDVAKADSIENSDNSIFIFGNLDVSFTKILCKKMNTACAFMPNIIEGKRNRNPFMTILQRKFIWIYWPAAKLKSNALFLLAALFIKIIGKIPSMPYATHGSVFSLNKSALTMIQEPIFNNKSFLYWEEIDFADLLNKYNIPLIESDIWANHARNIATFKIVKSRKKVIYYWAESWWNWVDRYK
jgi:hypothetical protein